MLIQRIRMTTLLMILLMTSHNSTDLSENHIQTVQGLLHSEEATTEINQNENKCFL